MCSGGRSKSVPKIVLSSCSPSAGVTIVFRFKRLERAFKGGRIAMVACDPERSGWSQMHSNRCRSIERSRAGRCLGEVKIKARIE